MLLAFDVENHYSFKDHASLSALRFNKRTDEVTSGDWDHRVSPVTVIYGPNASGKSNLLDAMSFARHIVSNGGAGENGPRDLGAPFLLDRDSRQEPSRYEFRFIAEDQDERREFVYEISTFRRRIESESLVVYRSTQPTNLFTRTHDGENDKVLIKLNRSIGKPEQTLIRKVTSKERPVLSSAAIIEDSSFRGAFDWFANTLRTYSAQGFESEHDRIKERLQNDDNDLRSNLLRYLKAADLGICSIEVNKISDETEARIRKALIDNELPEDFVETVLRDRRFSLSLGHSTEDGVELLPFGQESDGTKAMLSFGSIGHSALSEGGVLVIDEIDTSLHPMLVRHLVRQFTSPESNPRQAQLIVTTHDLGLISSWPLEDDILEKDQIWFVEKDYAGMSSLYSLAEFSPRQGENILRRYLMGHYGAIPKVGRND